MGQITHIKINCNDSSKINPIELLEVTKQEYETGELKGKKIVILCLDDTDQEEFDVKARVAGARYSEVISIIECIKKRIIGEMGY